MADETMQLLKAYIKATGYEISEKPHETMGLDFGAKEYDVTKKQPKPRAKAKESGYTDDFIKLWSIYPKCTGGSKKDAFKQYEARMKEYDPDNYHFNITVYKAMLSGTKDYAEFIEVTGQYAMRPERFFGASTHYVNNWEISESAKRQSREKQDWEFIPENDHLVFEWAKKHSFKVVGQDSVFATRRKLKSQIKARVESELNQL